jgi:hypothetical protein
MGSKVKQFLDKIKSTTTQQKNTQDIPELRDLHKVRVVHSVNLQIHSVVDTDLPNF